MFRAMIALLFSICLTGASTAHLATARVAQNFVHHNVQISMTQQAPCTHALCSQTDVEKPKTHQRCQVDVAPICVSQKMPVPEEYILRSVPLERVLKQTTRTPELKPPQTI